VDRGVAQEPRSSQALGAAENLRVVFELYDLAVAMVAQQHRRTNPGATEEEVDAAVLAWQRDRPGAPDGDCAGVRRDIPPPA
jgi:hypothetical protein